MKSLDYSLSQVGEAARFILDNAHSKIVCFKGDLGAGKTTLIKEICTILEIEGQVQSPTFGIANEYTLIDSGESIFHLDCYRLNCSEEALDFGIEEYLNNGKYVFIEWPDIVDSLLPEMRTEIAILLLSHESRRLTLKNFNT
ncbi:tRNA (adenosine(37)-N6)-threonylcarbamoyltransferase complex ATPase subunit type 1 TsaE [Robiginitalea biformata]|uniref:tRNA (adenosine(37)-N6)-threonylcarbamoyltransferase complex ATPase subunit type 1 TsaE n=1 Tax=Robiginitalea biformata TaxID=252307 RepID=UPI003B59AF49